MGQHAAERLDERGVLEWQVVDGIEDGSLIAERPNAEPNPAVEVRQSLAEGSEVKAVWSHVVSADVAKLIAPSPLDTPVRLPRNRAPRDWFGRFAPRDAVHRQPPR